MVRAENSKRASAVAAGHCDEHDEPEHLSGDDPAGPRRRRRRHHGHGHHRIVDVGPDERGRGDARGRPAGRPARAARQPSVRAGMAGPNGRSPRRVTRWA